MSTCQPGERRPVRLQHRRVDAADTPDEDLIPVRLVPMESDADASVSEAIVARYL